jgi:hypothetical protein
MGEATQYSPHNFDDHVLRGEVACNMSSFYFHQTNQAECLWELDEGVSHKIILKDTFSVGIIIGMGSTLRGCDHQWKVCCGTRIGWDRSGRGRMDDYIWVVTSYKMPRFPQTRYPGLVGSWLSLFRQSWEISNNRSTWLEEMICFQDITSSHQINQANQTILLSTILMQRQLLVWGRSFRASFAWFSLDQEEYSGIPLFQEGDGFESLLFHSHIERISSSTSFLANFYLARTRPNFRFIFHSIFCWLLGYHVSLFHESRCKLISSI